MATDRRHVPDIYDRLTPNDIKNLALTIAGEIDSRVKYGGAPYGSAGSRQEIANILQTIDNRARDRGLTPSKVVRQRSQYSTWNDERSKRVARDNLKKFGPQILSAMNDYYTGNLKPSNTRIDHYYASRGASKINPPTWTSRLTPIAQTNQHLFLAPPVNTAALDATREMQTANARRDRSRSPREFAGNLPTPRPPDPIKDFVAAPSMRLPVPATGSATIQGDPFGYPRDSPIYDSRLWAPTMQEAWGPSARALPNPSVNAQADPRSIFGRGTIDPAKTSARGMPAASATLAANALKSIPVGTGLLQGTAQALPSTPASASTMAARPITISGMVGTEGAPGKAKDDRIVPSQRASIPVGDMVRTAQQQLQRNGIVVKPTPVPTVSIAGDPAPNGLYNSFRLPSQATSAPSQTPAPQGGVRPPSVPTPQAPAVPTLSTGGLLDSLGLGQTANTLSAGWDKAKEMAAASPAERVLKAPGPIQEAIMAGKLFGGAPAFWSKINSYPNLPQSIVTQASRTAAQLYGTGGVGQPQARRVAVPVPVPVPVQVSRADPRGSQSQAAQRAAIQATLSRAGGIANATGNSGRGYY